ncbi:hypothetical protein EG68_01239 [Paragonimus skrjabini miyazakii]|uniref:Uncharacterized protein n=1 Tax=Paragonimus skrjabini miyazakii TaxID=59628 RepID=A0A8S9Z9Z3_9TREM|nr:hypothetical protein EG68_01239 [Paragonimus skrjabini miyazakii]
MRKAFTVARHLSRNCILTRLSILFSSSRLCRQM